MNWKYCALMFGLLMACFGAAFGLSILSKWIISSGWLSYNATNVAMVILLFVCASLALGYALRNER